MPIPNSFPSSVAGSTTQEVGYVASPHAQVAEWFHRERKRDRFTCEMLHRYLRDLGVPAADEPAWTTAVLIEMIPS